MNLRKQILTFTLFLATLTTTLHAQSKRFSISGKIEHPQATKVVLLQMFDAHKMKYVHVQNISVASDGSFKTNQPFVGIALYKLKVYNRSVRLAVDQPEAIRVTVKGEKSNKIMVTGSTGTKKLRSFRPFMGAAQGKHFAGLKEIAQKAIKEKDQAMLAKLEKIKHEKVALFLIDLRGFIDQMGTSAAAYYSLGFLDINVDLKFYEKVGEKFKKNAPNSPVYQAILKDVEHAKKTAVGAIAPAFTLTNLEGSNESLSQYKGKYVLIEFWASWCLGCRIEFPKLKSIYKKYKNRNFEILGISDDAKAKVWKAAVKKDQLPWKQLWIGKSKIRKDYKFNNMPFNVLIDKQGRIVAKRLTPEQLEAKLKELTASGK